MIYDLRNVRARWSVSFEAIERSFVRSISDCDEDDVRSRGNIANSTSEENEERVGRERDQEVCERGMR